MGIFRQFPYTNFHDLNLDEILRIIKDLINEWNNFNEEWDVDIAEEVDKWLEAHPEVTTTIQDGAITTAKLADKSVTFNKANNNLLDGIYAGLREYKINDTLTMRKNLLKPSSYDRNFVSRKTRTSYVDSNTWGLQSVEYIDYTNTIILGFTKNDDSGVCQLVEVSRDFSTVIRRMEGLQLGHCNDMAYNPTNNRLYVATMTTGVYARKIVEIDITTLTISNVIDVNRPIYQLSYDRVNNVFIAGSTEWIIYDTNFEIISTIPFDDFDSVIGTTSTGQGTASVNGNLILLKQNYEYSYLITFDYNTGSIEQIQRYKNTMAGDEAESLCFIPNDGLYIINGQNYISAYKFNLGYDSSDDDMFNILYSGEPIPSNSDLNNYFQSGKYYCATGAISDTITNKPTEFTSRGFNLYVITQSVDWVMQIIAGTGNLGKHFYFRMRSATADWSNWRALQQEAVMITPDGSPLAVNGTVTIPAYILNNYKVISICMHRGRYTGSVTIPTQTITNNDALNGSCIFATHDKYWEFGINPQGVITLTAESGLSDPYVKIAY